MLGLRAKEDASREFLPVDLPAPQNMHGALL